MVTYISINIGTGNGLLPEATSMDQCWLHISEVMWHSPANNSVASAQTTILYKEFENCYCHIFQGANELNENFGTHFILPHFRHVRVNCHFIDHDTESELATHWRNKITESQFEGQTHRGRRIVVKNIDDLVCVLKSPPERRKVIPLLWGLFEDGLWIQQQQPTQRGLSLFVTYRLTHGSPEITNLLASGN